MVRPSVGSDEGVGIATEYVRDRALRSGADWVYAGGIHDLFEEGFGSQWKIHFLPTFGICEE